MTQNTGTMKSFRWETSGLKMDVSKALVVAILHKLVSVEVRHCSNSILIKRRTRISRKNIKNSPKVSSRPSCLSMLPGSLGKKWRSYFFCKTPKLTPIPWWKGREPSASRCSCTSRSRTKRISPPSSRCPRCTTSRTSCATTVPSWPTCPSPLKRASPSTRRSPPFSRCSSSRACRCKSSGSSSRKWKPKSQRRSCCSLRESGTRPAKSTSRSLTFRWWFTRKSNFLRWHQSLRKSNQSHSNIGLQLRPKSAIHSKKSTARTSYWTHHTLIFYTTCLSSKNLRSTRL